MVPASKLIIGYQSLKYLRLDNYQTLEITSVLFDRWGVVTRSWVLLRISGGISQVFSQIRPIF